MAEYFQNKSDGALLNYNQMIADARKNHPEIESVLNTYDLTDFYDKIDEEQGRSLQYGYLGNGITVYDNSRIDPETHDYPIVAHISEEGAIRLYTEYLTEEDKSKIALQADEQEKLFKSSVWDRMSDASKLEEILSRSNTNQLLQIINDKLPLSERVAKYENSIVFGKEQFPIENDAPTKKTITPSGGATGDSDNTEMTGDRMGGREREFIIEKNEPDKNDKENNPFDIPKEYRQIDEDDLSRKRKYKDEQSEEEQDDKPKKRKHRNDYER